MGHNIQMDDKLVEAPLISNTFADLVKVETKASEGLQIEASFSYRLNKKEGDTKSFPKEFHVESFFFLPPQLNVNSSTYPISDFYRDMKSFINFRIPKLSYKELVGIGKNHTNSPIFRIQEFLQQNNNKVLTESAYKYLLQELRVWACAFFYFSDRRLQKLRRLTEGQKFDEALSPKAEDFLNRANRQNLTNVSNIFRVWSSTTKSLYKNHANASFTSGIRHVEEYVFMVLRDYVLEMQVLSQRMTQSPNYMQHPFKIQLRLLRWYSKNRGFSWLEARSQEQELEEYIYRKASLKKLIWSTLYIETRAQPLFQLRKQTGAMIAAGFAGFWAVAAEILINRNNSSAQTLNTSGFIIITALVLAYILKDRIKELGRNRFKSGLFGRLPDTKSKLLFDSGTAGKPIPVGTYSEKAYYESTKTLPKDLKQIISGTPMSHQQHIYYSKRIGISRKKVQRLQLKIRAVYDFFRISLSPLMFYVENNLEQICITDQKLNILVESRPKVYKIYLLIKVSGKIKPKHEPFYRYYQITVSKNRIHHIRTISHKTT